MLAIITGVAPISKHPLQAVEPDLEISSPTDRGLRTPSSNNTKLITHFRPTQPQHLIRPHKMLLPSLKLVKGDGQSGCGLAQSKYSPAVYTWGQVGAWVRPTVCILLGPFMSSGVTIWFAFAAAEEAIRDSREAF